MAPPIAEEGARPSPVGAGGAVASRVARMVAAHGLGRGPLTEPVHVPGAFADLAATFDLDAFVRRAEGEERLAPGRTDGPYGNVLYQGDTSYFAWFDADADRVEERQASPATYLATTTLPLPRWALEVQQALLDGVDHSGAYGWSAELFLSWDDGATMGTHADNDDVFTVQLAGEKEWDVDPVDLDGLAGRVARGEMIRDGAQSAWHFGGGVVGPERLARPRRFHLRPGDLLATPAFALHHVRAVGTPPALACNVSVCREERWLARERAMRAAAGGESAWP